ncbi:MAG: GTPase ObgE [Kiritimatiellae bacterium]|nr:GTPase ObgE [Kiritimatiellia bacterium]
MKAHTFVDSVALHVQAGAGGNGCVSFRREKFVPRGGPDGGDGGRGGHIILRGDCNENSLLAVYYTPDRRAEHGEHGKGKRCHGHDGKDIIIAVPCGTEIHDARTGECIGDIVADGEELLVAQGGRGGLGNCHWKSPTHQAPREHTDGEPGRESWLRLELKLMADVGLVGFPNAGKSSLLTAISDAHPKVAAYPFTTLNPIIGTVIFPDYSRVTVADIPGLIEGAHSGVGLGDAFLRHVERAPVLVHVIDMAGVDGRLPRDDYHALRTELTLYREDLVERPTLIVANKMDLPSAAENLREFEGRTGVHPMPVSAAKGWGLDELKDALFRLHAQHEH